MWARLRSFGAMIFQRSRWERDLRDEFEFHIAERADAFEREGLSRDDALRRARLQFRGLETAKEECREARGARWVDEIGRNVTCARRAIRQHPGFSSVAVISLALGIGANIAVFEVLHRLVLSTLPVRDPAQLYHVVVQHPARTAYVMPFPKFAVIRDNFNVFTLFGYGGFKRPVAIGESSERKYVIAVTGNYFDTLGVQPALAGCSTRTMNRPPSQTWRSSVTRSGDRASARTSTCSAARSRSRDRLIRLRVSHRQHSLASSPATRLMSI